MIGVIAPASDHAVIAEFFELFKTPWEFYRDERTYEVILCTLDENIALRAMKLTIFYAARELSIDAAEHVNPSSRGSNRILLYKGSSIPIYGDSIAFREEGVGLETDDDRQQAGMYIRHSNGRMVVRVGYDLFNEVGTLLTRGQPVDYAGIPTLELHIGMLRDFILASGAGLVEIPAVPAGYNFIVCLTHDVDHPSLVKHKWDRTVTGFLYRATAGSFLNFLKRSISLEELLVNWTAALRLPLLHLGLAKDFWRDFVHRYRELEKGLCSTYFIIPFPGRPGRDAAGMAPSYRAAQYGADDIADSIAEILASGGEVGLHGIDAWIDGAKGKEELRKIQKLTGSANIGSRMHWLFFNENSPALLEQAGVSYDSTNGYRETVGFRAGTTQAYKPIQAERILELPLHVMDTALFYPAYLGLTSRKATSLLVTLADLAERFGGCLTINWHDRSLSPERQWDKCYGRLLDDLKARGAWFATAGQAAAWFRKRRSVLMGPTSSSRQFSSNEDINGSDNDRLPRLQIRTHVQQVMPDQLESPKVIDDPLSLKNLGRVLCTTGN